MKEFYIHAELSQGPTWIQVDEVPPEGWSLLGVPAFIIEYDTLEGNVLLTIQLELGIWYGQRLRSLEEKGYLYYLENGPDDEEDLNYQSPLTSDELQVVGRAISRYMA